MYFETFFVYSSFLLEQFCIAGRIVQPKHQQKNSTFSGEFSKLNVANNYVMVKN